MALSRRHSCKNKRKKSALCCNVCSIAKTNTDAFCMGTDLIFYCFFACAKARTGASAVGRATAYCLFAGKEAEHNGHLVDKRFDAVKLAHVEIIFAFDRGAKGVVVVAYAVNEFGTYGVGRIAYAAQ